MMSASLAGCNLKDWWELEGTATIGVTALQRDASPVEGYQPALNEFTTLKLGVVGLSVKQAGELNPRHFSYQGQPLIIDLVEASKRDGVTPLIVEKGPLRAYQNVTVTVIGIEAITASGQSLPFCFPGQKNVTKPCVSIPANGAYRHGERPFSAPRGGTVEFGMAFEVLYNAMAKEYVIFRDPAQAVITTD